MIRFLCTFLFSAAVAPAFQSPDDAVDKDVYAIYSLMLTNPRTSHGADNNARYLIQEMTHPGNPRNPCVQAPKERAAEYREVLADFARRKGAERKLERKFEIAKPYILLKAEEADQFYKSRMVGRRSTDPPEDSRFEGVVDLITFTDVYFNPQRTLAVTQISTWCGGLCAAWQWKVFEKSKSGKWEEPKWFVCAATMAEKQVWDTNGHVEETNRSVRDRGGDLGRANAATAAP